MTRCGGVGEAGRKEQEQTQEETAKGRILVSMIDGERLDLIHPAWLRIGLDELK